MAADRKAEHLIVGNGIAGLSAAEAIRERDPQAGVTLLTEERAGFYSRPGLAYLLTGAIPEKQLQARPESHYRRLGLHRLVARAAQLEPERRLLHLQDGRVLHYEALLLATGASAVVPSVPGMELEGVVTLDTLDDARRILRLARRARRAVVVGGGITALEIAEGLAAQGVETHYLLRKDRYWGNVLDEDESRLVEGRLEEDGIRIHRHTELKRVLGRKRVEGIETQDGRKLRCDLLATAIGVRPRLELAHSAGIAVERGILVDDHMRTSAPGVYAAGDVAQAFDPASGESVLDTLWWVARRQGAVAGANMAGGDLAYERLTPFNVTRIGGLITTIIGAVGQGARDEDLVAINRGDSEVWRRKADTLAVESDHEDDRVRLLVGRDRLVGAVVMGDQALSRPLQDLISQQVDISPFRERLLASPAQIPVLIPRIWGVWKGGRLAP